MLYKRLLEGDFERLSPALRKLHAWQGCARARGSVSVRHEHGWLARLVGFPQAGDNIPLELTMDCAPESETWTRTFGSSVRRSVQRCGDGLMVEQLGPLSVRFRIFADGGDLRLESRGARYWFVPVPVRIHAVERGRDNGWEFEVNVALIGSYRGVMEFVP